MILKILSSVVIVICCGLIGLYKANRYIQRVKEIRMLKTALIQLETEIIYFSNFMSDALSAVAKSVQGPWRDFFYKVARVLADRTEYSVAECWRKNLDYYKKQFFIGEPEYEILVRFGSNLGTSDSESQKKYFELAQQQLLVEERKAEELCSKYVQMYRSLGILCGLAIAIILF